MSRAFLTVDEMAALLGCSTKTIRRRIADGAIRKAPFGGRAIRIPVAELDRLSGVATCSGGGEIDQPNQAFGNLL